MKRLVFIFAVLILFFACEQQPIINDEYVEPEEIQTADIIDSNGYHEQRMQFVNANDGDYLTGSVSQNAIVSFIVF